ncbi:DUF2804 domain-containing protein [Iamia sp. SCSIO 61187]|uniref:DUF2804 domain-containing protein n=1 Tax=Iamia sp. SCSIO 61187 TaxID=2722752 RepID=UPI001C62C53B|nr:DUF2804 domain-containing protein [Iamia sp. SCSIO 61187]QYG94020.1 DUF2804 domain-containing protein [Iamia sp. SCSIO 61187]
MTTHERELFDPVDLCTPDGDRLAAAARGWSRTPLHRANLHGHHGRNKRWDYWAVLAGDLVVSAVYADIDHLGLIDVWWADIPSGDDGGASAVVASDAVSLPERCGTVPLTLAHPDLDIAMTDDGTGTRLTATWREPDGRAGALDVAVALPPGHESLNVVIPWDDEVFTFTSKHQARPATGTLEVGDRRWVVGGSGGDAWGVLDVGRGRWPSTITWNWGSGAGRAGDHVVGLNVGARWTEGTGFTENGFVVDGVLTKIGRELRWDYDWDDPMAPWRISDPEGQLDVTLTPRYDKHSRSGRDDGRGSETHQVFGTFAGSVRTDDGRTVTFDALQGFAEEVRHRGW